MQPTLQHPAIALIAAASRELSARVDTALALLDAGAPICEVAADLDTARLSLNAHLSRAQASIMLSFHQETRHE